MSKKHSAATARIGELEQLVLLALLRLGDEAYGMAVHDEILTRTGRQMSFATIYTTLTRLEDKGLIRSRLGEPTAARGGRRKRHFVLVEPGRLALKQSLRDVGRMLHGIDPSWDTP